MLYEFGYKNKNNKLATISYSMKNNITIIPISYIYDIKNYISFYKQMLPINKKRYSFKILDYIKEGYIQIPITNNNEYIFLKNTINQIYKNKLCISLYNSNEETISNNCFMRLMKTKYEKDIKCYKTLIGLKYINKYKNIYSNSINIVGIETIKNVYIHKEMFLKEKNENKNISLNDFISYKEFHNKDIVINNILKCDRKIVRNTNYISLLKALNRIKDRISYITFNPIEASISTINNLYINKHGRTVYDDNKREILLGVCKFLNNNSDKEIENTNFIVVINKNKYDLSIKNNSKFTYNQYYNDMNVYDKDYSKFTYNQYYNDINIYDKDYSFLNKNKYDLSIKDNSKFIYNQYYNDMNIYDKEYSFLSKSKKYLYNKQYTKSLDYVFKYKKIKTFNHQKEMQKAKKYLHENNRNIWIDNTLEYFYEKQTHLRAERFKQVMFKTKTYEYLNSNYEDLHLFNSKVNMNKNNKYYKYYNQNITINKVYKYFNTINNIYFANKQNKYINKQNEHSLFINKDNKYINILNYDNGIAKDNKYINILNYDNGIAKENKYKIFSSIIVGINKDKGIFKQQDGFININGYYNLTNIFENNKALLNISQQDKELTILNKDKFISQCKIIAINKTLTLEQANELALNIEKDNEMFIFKMKDVFSYDKIASKLMLDSDFKEVYYEQSKKYKWLDGGEDDFEMKLDKYGIDELILPYNDYNYEILKNTLIDKNGKPLVPYDEIDKNSFTAKIPLQNPVPCFNDIGLEYIDVDVGILVHLLNTMYKLWRKKIFKYGAMDIKDSMECMLSDLKDYIFLTFSGDDLKIASRVFRLFRWYAEMTMNKCCTYKVSLEYGPMYSELDKGKCSIPYKLTNMYIDKNKYIITNSILNKECQCSFDIDNPIDTNVTLCIYISDGECSIILNNEQVLILEKGLNNITIPIKRLDKSNILKIYYNSINNGIIKISNVVISDMLYKDAKIEYYPKIGEGNMFMDLLVKNLNLTAITDIYSDEEMDKIKENNYHISSTLNRIKEYIDLHHVNKIKGKRLTIKKS